MDNNFSILTQDKNEDVKLILCAICKEWFNKESAKKQGCNHICLQCKSSAKKICTSYSIAGMKCPKCREEVTFKEHERNETKKKNLKKTSTDKDQKKVLYDNTGDLPTLKNKEKRPLNQTEKDAVIKLINCYGSNKDLPLLKAPKIERSKSVYDGKPNIRREVKKLRQEKTTIYNSNIHKQGLASVKNISDDEAKQDLGYWLAKIRPKKEFKDIKRRELYQVKQPDEEKPNPVFDSKSQTVEKRELTRLSTIRNKDTQNGYHVSQDQTKYTKQWVSKIRSNTDITTDTINSLRNQNRSFLEKEKAKMMKMTDEANKFTRLESVYRGIRDIKRQFGGEGTRSGQFICPSGITTGPNGVKWVVDQGNNRVQKFDKRNDFVKSVGNEGSAEGLFMCPRDVAAFKTGTIVVTDGFNQRIQTVSEAGYPLNCISTKTSNEEYSCPEGVAVYDDNIYVSDSWNHNIKVFNSQLKFLFKFGGFGTRDGKFYNPDYLTVNEDRIIVSDTENNRLQEFDHKGHHLNTIEEFGRGDFSPRGITTDFEGNIIFIDSWQGAVHILTSEYNHIKTIKYNYTTEHGLQRILFSPCAVAVNEYGKIFVSDVETDKILIF